MLQKLKIGPEQEFSLYNDKFMIIDASSQVLDNPANIKPNGHPYFVKEGTQAQIELNWKPSISLDHLCLQFLEADGAARKMFASSEETKDIKIIPASENGAGLATISKRVAHRTPIYKAIFGDIEHLIRISGIHNHIDRCPNHAIEQFNVLAAMVPGIAFTSNSPIDYKRINGFNDSRYNLFANPKTGYFKKIPEELTYIKDLQELEVRDQNRYTAWRNAYLASVGNTILFDQNFTIANTGYPAIRNRPDVGKLGTFEARKDDSTTLDIHLGNTGFMLGACNQTCKGIKVEYATIDGDYDFNSQGDGRIVLPTKEYLANTLICQGVQTGLQSEELHHYLTQLLKFAHEGLPEEERHYLNPLFKMINSQENLSTQVLEHLRINKYHTNTKKEYSLEAIQEANKFVWERQQKAIEHFRKLHHYKS